MTKLSAPTPNPSTPKRPAGRYIDFVARPKTGAKSIQATVKSTQTTSKPTQAALKTAPVSKPVSEEPESAAPAPVEAVPRRRHIAPKGLRMDFVRRPTNSPLPEIKVKKSVQISIASPSAEAMPEMSTPRRAAPSAEAMPEMSTPRRAIRQIRPIILEPKEPKELEELENPEDEITEPLLDESEPLMDDTEPLMDDDDLSLALAGFADDDDDMPSLTDDRAREVTDLEAELNALDELDEISDDLEAEIADFVDEPKPIFEKSEKAGKAEKSKKADAPDANRFTLGGRSPFLTSVKVEKRPLSGLVPDEDVQPIKKEIKTPLKNAYRAKIKQVLKSDKTDEKEVVHRETTIVATPNTPVHNLSLAFAILLTIILGGLIGAVVYLVFFQQ